MARTILNFSGHILSDKAVAQIRAEYGEDTQIKLIKVALSRRHPLFEQVHNMMKEFVDLSDGQQPIIILPGLPIAGAFIIAYIHGTVGCFPRIIELLRNQDSVWEYHDTHDLEFYRHESRRNR